ncbi:MAG TPA: hypothetical protein VJ783_30030 [Pirellulales bacterium]|nr:hypothetical protein [Pirellulales bacterium]
MRTLLVALTFLAILLGGWVNRARRQREAVAAIRAAHGEVRYDDQFGKAREVLAARRSLLGRLTGWLDDSYLRDVVAAFLDNDDTFDGTAFHAIAALPDIKYLELGTWIKDANLESIEGLAKLRHLALRSPQLTDAGLVHLTPLKRLTYLAIWDSQINGTGLKHLRGLTKLKNLNLGGTWVDDAVLLQVAEIPTLKSIELVDANVTDIGLSHLTKMASLESLVLSGTQVTEEGRRAFRQAMPKCKLE